MARPIRLALSDALAHTLESNLSPKLEGADYENLADLLVIALSGEVVLLSHEDYDSLVNARPPRVKPIRLKEVTDSPFNPR